MLMIPQMHQREKGATASMIGTALSQGERGSSLIHSNRRATLYSMQECWYQSTCRRILEIDSPQ